MSTEIVGKIVKGPSGRHLGRALEVAASRFSIDIDGKPVWVPRDTIFSVEDEELTVIFEPSAIDRYAIAVPNAERSA